MMRQDPKPPSPPRGVQSVHRAVDLLEQLASTAGGLRLAELARRVSLPPQTAQSLLRTLQARRLVIQAGRGKPYMLGPALGAMRRQWVEGGGPAATAEPIVRAFARECGEYVLLAQLRGLMLVPVVEVQSSQALGVTNRSFGPERLHAMATGQVLLAWMEEPARGEALAQLPLGRLGPRSITEPPALQRRLRAIRRDGFTICLEESGAHVAAMAAPVLNSAGEAMAALGVYLPLARFGPTVRPRLLTRLRAAAAEIAAAWGGVGRGGSD
jgi:IclR family acetate operon transcriptional repressor